MDRCALFVDAGYLLAGGAMAVHGTRHRDNVAWNYVGLLQALSDLGRERTGLPTLRCYWYEATVEGRRSPELDGLADLPGLKLRLGRIRPGGREGVDTEIQRDLMTLARNGAISDAVVISGDEDLTQIISDAQDFGVRVTMVQVVSEGNWSVSRLLRQESDDMVELDGAQLRPFAELQAVTSGASRPPALAGGANSGPNAMPSVPNQAAQNRLPNQQYQVPRQGGPVGTPPQGVPAGHAARPAALHGYGVPSDRGGADVGRLGTGVTMNAAPTGSAAPAEATGYGQGVGGHPVLNGNGNANGYGTGYGSGTGDHGNGGSAHSGGRGYGDPAIGGPANGNGASGNAGYGNGAGGTGGYGNGSSGGGYGNGAANGGGAGGPDRALGVANGRPDGASGGGAGYGAGYGSGYRGGAHNSPINGSPLPAAPPQAPAPTATVAPVRAQQYAGAPAPAPSPGGPYSGPQQMAPRRQAPSLADAVKAAHQEGQDFGESVARDAPALWLEAVLARKPRMPSDLEARLLQGSSLPIDFLLHDEVRHALRRGFWDALERSRR